MEYMRKEDIDELIKQTKQTKQTCADELEEAMATSKKGGISFYEKLWLLIKKWRK